MIKFRGYRKSTIFSVSLGLLVLVVAVICILPLPKNALGSLRLSSRSIGTDWDQAGCGNIAFVVSEEQTTELMPNFRQRFSISVGLSDDHPAFLFYVFRATGREMLFAPESALTNTVLLRCVSIFSRFVLDGYPVHLVHGERVANETLPVTRPEPAFLERMIPENVRLPKASIYLSDPPWGKLYLDDLSGDKTVSESDGDAQKIANDAKAKEPRMEIEEVTGWRILGLRLHGSGRHLDWGTGSSSHFACALHRNLHAIDSGPKWCSVVQSAIARSQSHCKQIQMHCIDVGKTAAWGIPIVNVTQPGYFERYVHAIDVFQQPYFDSILVDGRFRTACAVKALSYMRRDSYLMIHDFGGERVIYNNVLKYYDIIAKYGTLIVLTPKDNITSFAPAEYVQYKSHM